MECVDAYIAGDGGVFALYYEEASPGQHLSRIYYSDGSGRTVRVISEAREWLVSLWADARNGLFAASWDGRILRVSPGSSTVAECDLLGAIRLTGFDDDDVPRFLIGEDGGIFENRDGQWTLLSIDSEADLYSVAKRADNEFLFVGSGGTILTYVPGVAPVASLLPTNVDLHGVAFISAKNGIAVGELGTRFVFRNGAWEDVTSETGTFHDVIAFKDGFMATVEGEGLATIDAEGNMEMISPLPGYYLSTDDETLVTFSEEAIIIYDGNAFSEIPHEQILSADL